MSSKNRKTESDPLDRYYTPKWAVDLCRRCVLEPYYSDHPMSYIMEPSAGEGVWVRGLREQYPEADISALDIDHNVGPWPEADESYEGDFLETDFAGNTWDLVAGNPPFTPALKFVEESMRLSSNIVFLLRLGFLATRRRNDFFKLRPPNYVFLLPNRPGFIEGKSSGDSTDYAFICWKHGPYTGTQLKWLPTIPLDVRKGERELFSLPEFSGQTLVQVGDESTANHTRDLPNWVDTLHTLPGFKAA